jgi:exopolysaccharide biosynthesis WecB/TagA/CpsF family protein
VALYGAAPTVAQRAAEQLLAMHPTAVLMGDAGPTFRAVDDLKLSDVAALRDFRPDICCVAFGNPKQEYFIDRFGRQLGIPVMIGVGGSLDFIVGEQTRAPAWMQRSGLEWVHRAWTERHRLPRRYLHDAGVFFPRLAKQVWRGRRSRRNGRVHIIRNADALTIDMTELGDIDNRTGCQIAAAIRSAWLDRAHIEIHGAERSRLAAVPGLSELVAAASTAA